MLAILVCLILQGSRPTETGTVEGVVLNSVTKEPVRKAQVRIQPTSGSGVRRVFGVVSDASGHFAAPGLDPGEYVLSAMKAGFLGAYAPGGVRGSSSSGAFANVKLSAGDSVRNIELLLAPGGVVTGRVVDEDGDPLAGASVALSQPRGSRARRQPGRMTNAMSNDKGEFRIANVVPGKYVLAAELMSRGGGNLEPPGGVKGPEMGYAATYFPGVTDPAQAAPIEVLAGQELSGLEVALRRTPVFRVRGRVVDGEGNKPGERAYVFLAPREGRMSGRQLGSGMMQEGRFEITGVPPGSYTVVAQRMDRNDQMIATEPLDVSASNVEGLTLTLQPGMTLQGRTAVEGESTVTARNLGVSLMPADGAGYTPPPRFEAKDDGSFVLRSVYPGRYRVQYFSGGRGTVYLASAKYNDVDVTFGDLEIGPGGAGTLHLVFRSDGGKVAGSVRAGDSPAAGAGVLLMPAAEERRTQSSVFVVSAGPDGSYQFSGIRPGDYYLIAVDGVESAEWDDPDWVKSRQDKMQKVSVQANGSANVPLQLAPSDDKK